MPYHKANALVERELEVWGTRCVTNVTEPTLTIYAAKGTNSKVSGVIIPGGNREVVAIHHEGRDVAKALSDQGIMAAVLKYRLPNPASSPEPGKVPLADARRAPKLLRQHAARHGIDARKVGVLGFTGYSAGQATIDSGA